MNRRRTFLTAGAAAALAVALPAYAQAPAAGGAEVVDLSEVVITAVRSERPRAAVPSTVQIIDPVELQAQTALGASAVEAVANLVPSFSPTRQKLSGSGETLRGRSPLYLVDGVPQSTPLRDDARDGFTIDPFFIERIEVVFGSNAIQGVGATGGVINYVTVPTPRGVEGWSGKALAQTTFDDGVVGDSLGWKTAGIVGRDFGSWDASLGAAYEARGAYYDAEGRRIGIDGAQGELQDSKSWSLFGKAGLDLSDTRRIELMANHFELEGDNDYVAVPGDRARGIPTSAMRGTAPGLPTSNEITSAAATYRDRDLFGGVLTAQVYAHDYEGVFGGGVFATFQDPAFAPVGTLYEQSANNSEKLGFKVDYERGFAGLPGFRALVGLDGIRDKTYQQLVLTGRDWVPETTYESLAPFVQLHQELAGGRLHLSGGVRHEMATLKVDDFRTLWSYGAPLVQGGEPTFEETLWNVGVTYELVEGLVGYASYAEGFTMADVGRVLRGINQPGQDVDTFLDVSPVISDNIEAGLELNRGPYRASVAWFSSSSDRGSRLVRGLDGIYSVQRQRIEIEGVEAAGRWAVNEWLTVGASYAHLDGRTDGDGDGVVDRDLDGANIAPGRLLAYGEAGRGAWTGRLQVQQFYSRSFEGEPPANDFEGYVVADAVLTWRAPAATVTVGVQNLFDEQYVTYFSDTQLPTNNNRFFAGRGRTLVLGVSRSF